MKKRPQDVVEVRYNPRSSNDTWREIGDLAKAHRIPIRFGISPETRPNREGVKEGREGGAQALVKELEAQTLDEIFLRTKKPGIWLALDCLQDPHNVGAVVRTASFFGVRGIVHTKDKSAPLSAVVYDTATGGMESVPFALPPNLAGALEIAQKKGLWVLGTSEHAEKSIDQIDRDRDWLVVVGNEEKGLRRLTLDRSDEVCRVSPRGEVTSLNVSVATGVLLALLTPPAT